MADKLVGRFCGNSYRQQWLVGMQCMWKVLAWPLAKARSSFSQTVHIALLLAGWCKLSEMLRLCLIFTQPPAFSLIFIHHCWSWPPCIINLKDCCKLPKAMLISLHRSAWQGRLGTWVCSDIWRKKTCGIRYVKLCCGGWVAKDAGAALVARVV